MSENKPEAPKRHPVIRRVAAALTAAVALTVPSSRDILKPTVAVRADAPAFTGQGMYVLVANVHGGRKDEGGDNSADFKRALKETWPTIVCGAEGDFDGWDGIGDAIDIGYNAIEAPTRAIPGYDGSLGNFVLSLDRIELIKVYNLPGSFYRKNILLQPRKMIHAKVTKQDGTKINVLATHLGTDPKEAARQVDFINTVIEDLPDNEQKIFCGDLNSQAVTIQHSSVGQSMVPRGMPPAVISFPARSPDRSLDIVLFQGATGDGCGMNANSSVPQSVDIGSDHDGALYYITVSNCMPLKKLSGMS